MCVGVYVSVHVCMCVCVCGCVFLYVCVYVCMYVLCMWMCLCVCVCMYVCVLIEISLFFSSVDLKLYCIVVQVFISGWFLARGGKNAAKYFWPTVSELIWACQTVEASKVVLIASPSSTAAVSC
jgi:hypothetical protein